MIKNTLFKNPQKGDYHSSEVDYIILDDRYAELSFGWLHFREMKVTNSQAKSQVLVEA